MGWYLGIDFSSILVDLGSQVGRQNRAKIDQKWHRKNDEKKKGNKMAKKSQFEIQIGRGPAVPDPWGGSPPLGLDKPRPPSQSVARFSRAPLLPRLALSCQVLPLSVLSWLVLSSKSHSCNAWKGFLVLQI